jgi:O-antigen/teichoic acid export membrane protein
VYVFVSFFDITDIVILGAIISVTPVLVLLLGTFVIFFIKRKDLRPSPASINLSYLNSILGVGIKFFFLQIITILFYQSSNIIIAQTLDQARVAEFNIAFKYIGIISMLFTIVVTPYWSSATESYHKGDLMWINRSVINLRKVLAVLAIFGLILISVSNKLYTLWIGESIKPDTVLLSLLLLYFCTNMYYSLHGYILNGIGKVQLQLIVTSFLALGFIPIAIILTSNYGLYGLVSALTVVSVGNAAWSSLQYQKVISGRATGIFNK